MSDFFPELSAMFDLDNYVRDLSALARHRHHEYRPGIAYVIGSRVPGSRAPLPRPGAHLPASWQLPAPDTWRAPAATCWYAPTTAAASR